MDGNTEHLHQLATLFGHIVREHPAQPGIYFEQPSVKQLGHGVAQRRNFLERGLDMSNLFWGHFCLHHLFAEAEIAVAVFRGCVFCGTGMFRLFQ